LTVQKGKVKRAIATAIFAVSAAALYAPVGTSAQDAPPPEQPPEPPPLIARPPAEIGDETGEVGLPGGFFIEFGDNNDWIQFKAGEWLKGELKWMRQKEAQFRSKKLKLMTFNWKDIVQLQARKTKTFVFEGKVVESGRAMVTREEVIIETANGVKVYPRDQLVSILRGEPRERNYWSTRIRAGLSGAAGNSRNLSLNAFWSLMRADQRTRSLVSYEGAFGYAAKEETVNRHIGDAEMTVYVTAQFLNDRFQNLRLRATPSAGVGVHLFDTRKVEWNLDGGPGYQYTNLLSAEAGTTNPQHDGTVSLGSFFKWKFIPDNKIELEWRSNLVYTQLGLTNHTGNARLKLKITSIFRFTTEFTYLRTERPPPREDGTRPKSDDYQLVVGVLVRINE
jgi:putative salt-induced outer membrane protein YdiY